MTKLDRKVTSAYTAYACTITTRIAVERSMSNAIEIDPNICHGKPVIAGTRVPVAIVVGSLAGGMSLAEVRREYGLTEAQIRAALKFAGELVEQESFHPISAN